MLGVPQGVQGGIYQEGTYPPYPGSTYQEGYLPTIPGYPPGGYWEGIYRVIHTRKGTREANTLYIHPMNTHHGTPPGIHPGIHTLYHLACPYVTPYVHLLART